MTVDLAGVEDWRDDGGCARTALGEARDAVASEHLVARLRLTGTTPLAWRLRRDLDLLLTEAEAQAAGSARPGSTRSSCSADRRHAPRRASDRVEADPLEELGRLMEQIAAG